MHYINKFGYLCYWDHNTNIKPTNIIVTSSTTCILTDNNKTYFMTKGVIHALICENVRNICTVVDYVFYSKGNNVSMLKVSFDCEEIDEDDVDEVVSNAFDELYSMKQVGPFILINNRKMLHYANNQYYYTDVSERWEKEYIYNYAKVGHMKNKIVMIGYTPVKFEDIKFLMDKQYIVHDKKLYYDLILIGSITNEIAYKTRCGALLINVDNLYIYCNIPIHVDDVEIDDFQLVDKINLFKS